MRSRRCFLVGIFALMSACAETLPVKSTTVAYDIQLASDGLHVPSVGQRIDFGRAEEGSIAVVAKLLDAQPSGSTTKPECGASPIKTVSWGVGLNLLFQEGNFRGWSSENAIFATTNGYSAGMTGSQLTDAGVTLEPTTLGSEFDIGGVFGVIEEQGPTGHVKLLWAGLSCFFR